MRSRVGSRQLGSSTQIDAAALTQTASCLVIDSIVCRGATTAIDLVCPGLRAEAVAVDEEARVPRGQGCIDRSSESRVVRPIVSAHELLPRLGIHGMPQGRLPRGVRIDRSHVARGHRFRVIIDEALSIDDQLTHRVDDVPRNEVVQSEELIGEPSVI